MTEISGRNSISFKSCTPISDFSAEHPWKTENWITNGIEHAFSTKLFNKINIIMRQVSFWAVWLAICFGWPISYAQLNWISDRKLEKLAWSTWSFYALVLYELFMKFSEWKIWIGLWIHSIHRKYTLSHLVHILHCFVDSDIAGCVESVHWLKYVLS